MMGGGGTGGQPGVPINGSSSGLPQDFFSGFVG